MVKKNVKLAFLSFIVLHQHQMYQARSNGNFIITKYNDNFSVLHQNRDKQQ